MKSFVEYIYLNVPVSNVVERLIFLDASTKSANRLRGTSYLWTVDKVINGVLTSLSPASGRGTDDTRTQRREEIGLPRLTSNGGGGVGGGDAADADTSLFQRGAEH